MLLKKLTLVGFKSFADPITLEFHTGITAIVGPNGCGKSNIADAFRWVLGEQSAKSLRGAKMQDIIFAGTSKRKPLNLAEVTLTLNNPEGNLRVGYEEVKASRTLHRSGESEYRINNQEVRLKDLQDVFLDSGIGKNAFAIFEQGKIDQIIQYNPLERRYIFEEAAGILRFLQRKKEALRRLEQTDLNTSRLKDIHLEVERHIALLEEQAEKAELYKENRAALETLEKALLAAKWKQAAEQKEETTRKKIQLADKKQACEAQKIALETGRQEAMQNLLEGENLLKKTNEEVYKTTSEKTIRTKEKQNHYERLQEAVKKRNHWEIELEQQENKRKARQADRQILLEKLESTKKQLTKHEASAKEQREKTSRLEQELSKVREQQQSSQQEFLQILQQENQIESDVKQTTIRYEHHSDRKKRILERKEVLLAQQLATAKQLTEAENKAAVGSEGIEKQKKQLDALQQQREELTRDINTLEKKSSSLQQELQELKARQKVLQRMHSEFEGFTASSKKLLLQSQNPKSPLYKKIKGLHEYLAPKKGSEVQLAIALKSYVQTLVVETKDDLLLALNYAREEKLKDFSFLCLAHTASDRSSQQASPPFSFLLDAVADNAISHHMLANTAIAPERADAHQWVASQGGEAVSEGLFIDHKQVVFQTHQTESNVYLREAELKELDGKLLDADKQFNKNEEKKKELQQKNSTVHKELLEKDRDMRKAEMSLLEINFSLQKLLGDQKKAHAEISSLEADLQTIEASLEAMHQGLQEQKKHLVEAKAKTQACQKQSLSLQNLMHELAQTTKGEVLRLQEQEMHLHKMTDENRKISHSLHVLDIKDLESVEQERKLKQELETLQQQLARYESETQEIETKILNAESFLLAAIESNSRMEIEMAQRRKNLENENARLEKVWKEHKQAEIASSQTEILREQHESTLLAIEKEAAERYKKTVEEVIKEAPLLTSSIDQIEKHVRSLRQELESVNDINLAAIEERKKNQGRYEILSEQIEDLRFSRQQLIEVMTDLDEESRVLFKNTFQIIRENFQRNFRILFNGGEADLQFTESEDILEAGIDIIARPPGKHMRSIQLLSGGEKCLTAMALLFAIFEVKPAPFCILDEIDAPLDDTNVDRFVNMVKHYVDRCQFIIITHNKRTMAIADVLFGISMQERGVSKLLSMEFSSDAVVVR